MNEDQKVMCIIIVASVIITMLLTWLFADDSPKKKCEDCKEFCYKCKECSHGYEANYLSSAKVADNCDEYYRRFWKFWRPK